VIILLNPIYEVLDIPPGKEVDDVEEIFENDLFNRREQIEILTELFENIHNPLVISINSKWGTGKTTFIKLWKSYLENKNYITQYFNAWEHDLSHEPLMAFLNCFVNMFKDKEEKDDNDKYNKLTETMKEIGKEFFKNESKIGYTLKFYEKYNDNKNDKSKFDKIIEDEIEYFKIRKSSIKKFKAEIKDKIKNKPVVFFIDELDRCRPDFALDVIEQLKHIFRIPGVIFVLSIAKKQLLNSVNNVYGAEINANKYLNRFIDIEYNLPEGEDDEYIQSLIDRLNIYENLNQIHAKNSEKELFDDTLDLLDRFDLNLREKKKILNRYKLLLLSKKDSNIFFGFLYLFLICLNHIDSEFYNEMINENKSYKEIIFYLNNNSKIKTKNFFKKRKRIGFVIKGTLLKAYGDEEDINKLKKNIEKLEQKKGKQFNQKMRFLSKVNEIANSTTGKVARARNIKKINRKINIMSRLKYENK